MRLKTIRNESKQIISASGGLGLLQMISALREKDCDVPHFKTVMVTTIHNGPKRTISTNSGLGLLQTETALKGGGR